MTLVESIEAALVELGKLKERMGVPEYKSQASRMCSAVEIALGRAILSARQLEETLAGVQDTPGNQC